MCVIGPSHIAALRDAEKEGLVDTSAHAITYFGHYTRVFSTLTLTGTRLRLLAPRQLAEDLKVSVDIADYDALFLCAVIRDPARILNRSRLRLSDMSTMSQGLAARQIGNALRTMQGFDVIAEIRAAFDGPVLISAAPLRAQQEDAPAAGPGFERFTAAQTAALAELGLTFVPQPAETVTAALTTRREYSVGSVKLGGHEEHRAEDVTHMNSAYGALIYQGALDRLCTPATVGP